MLRHSEACRTITRLPPPGICETRPFAIGGLRTIFDELSDLMKPTLPFADAIYASLFTADVDGFPIERLVVFGPTAEE